jgi:transcriptional regulator with XRE-family HTH domain
MVTIAQIKAARGLLDWSQPRLANAAGLSEMTVKRFEAHVGSVSQDAISRMRVALEAAGVEFTNGNQSGVRLARIQDRERTGKDFI